MILYCTHITSVDHSKINLKFNQELGQLIQYYENVLQTNQCLWTYQTGLRSFLIKWYVYRTFKLLTSGILLYTLQKPCKIGTLHLHYYCTLLFKICYSIGSILILNVYNIKKNKSEPWRHVRPVLISGFCGAKWTEVHDSLGWETVHRKFTPDLPNFSWMDWDIADKV